MPHLIELTASLLFGIAILHTFAAPLFAHLAHQGGRHAGLYHLLSEVEAVFGVWAAVLIACMALVSGNAQAAHYMDTRNFTDPLFVFAIMVTAASRPILELVGGGVRLLARALPWRQELATFLVVMTVVPLAGSFITEPAAMTLAALLLRDRYFRGSRNSRFMYLTVGVLFVNVSIGGVLTSYAAPPVLMVASTFGWDAAHMLTHFGWRAAAAVFINAGVLTFACRAAIAAPRRSPPSATPASASLAACPPAPAGAPDRPDAPRTPVPVVVTLVHLAFLVGIVVFAHHAAIFMGLLLLFIGYTEAYKRHQDTLMIKEGLMVGFFLAGLIVLGGMQQWWLQDLLGGLAPGVLFWGATVLTALTDNAALTYLGSLVQGTSEAWRYMLVAGAVTGGGLTVIANAPNPAGFAILKGEFPDGTIAAGKLLLCALAPTAVAAVMFLLPGPA